MFDVHEMEVNFGPQHPSTHGVLRVLLTVDGERIINAKPVIGYLHRGTEKLFEHMAYPQCIPHTDRMDYVASATNNLKLTGTATAARIVDFARQYRRAGGIELSPDLDCHPDLCRHPGIFPDLDLG